MSSPIDLRTIQVPCKMNGEYNFDSDVFTQQLYLSQMKPPQPTQPQQPNTAYTANPIINQANMQYIQGHLNALSQLSLQQHQHQQTQMQPQVDYTKEQFNQFTLNQLNQLTALSLDPLALNNLNQQHQLFNIQNSSNMNLHNNTNSSTPRNNNSNNNNNYNGNNNNTNGGVNPTMGRQNSAPININGNNFNQLYSIDNTSPLNSPPIGSPLSYDNLHNPFLNIHGINNNMSFISYTGASDYSTTSPGNSSDSDEQTEADRSKRQRQAHTKAEKKRRGNINAGFEELQSMLPSPEGESKMTTNSGRFSKASILQKAVDYIGYLLKEKSGLLQEVERLRQEIKQLKALILKYKELDSDTGLDINERAKRFIALAKEKEQALDFTDKENIKFYVFCTVVDRLFETFNSMVSLESSEEFSTSLLAWFEKYCQPENLRGIFLTSLQSFSSGFFNEDSAKIFGKWSGAFNALSICKDSLVMGLDNSNVPMAKTLGKTIDSVGHMFYLDPVLGNKSEEEKKPIAAATPSALSPHTSNAGSAISPVIIS